MKAKGTLQFEAVAPQMPTELDKNGHLHYKARLTALRGTSNCAMWHHQLHYAAWPTALRGTTTSTTRHNQLHYAAPPTALRGTANCTTRHN